MKVLVRQWLMDIELMASGVASSAHVAILLRLNRLSLSIEMHHLVACVHAERFLRAAAKEAHDIDTLGTLLMHKIE